MQRGSDKHGSGLDQHMKKETPSIERGGPVETRLEEHVQQQPSGDDQPVADEALTDPAHDDAPLELDHDQIEERSQLAQSVQPSAFPGDRDALVASAREMNAPGRIVQMLKRLPAGRTFENVQAVWAELGGKTEAGSSTDDVDRRLT